MSTKKKGSKPATAAADKPKKKHNMRSKKELALIAIDRVIKAMPKLPGGQEAVGPLAAFRVNLVNTPEDQFPRLSGRQKAEWAPGTVVVVKEKFQAKYDGVVTKGTKLKLISKHERSWKCEFQGMIILIPKGFLEVAK